MNAFARVWPGIAIGGCLFHLCQALFRQCGMHGLTRLLSHNTEFCRLLRETCCLALHPAENIEKVWNKYVKPKYKALSKRKSLRNFANEIDQFRTYFQRTWITKIGPAKFSCFKEVIATTNALDHG